MIHDLDLEGVVELISSKRNPELWHVANGTHPGIGWSIKTITPKIEFASDDTIGIMEIWLLACGLENHIAFVTEAAYDWDGNSLEQWQTIWLRDGWDIEPTDGPDGMVYKVLTANEGYTNTAKKLLDDITSAMAHLDDGDSKSELAELADICNAMASNVTNDESLRLRRNIRLLDD